MMMADNLIQMQTDQAAEALIVEQAQALGFNTVEEMEAHQRWLEAAAAYRNDCIAAVNAAEQSQSAVIELPAWEPPL